jgi:ATPase family protein associated with various cellular activities (AAA)
MSKEKRNQSTSTELTGGAGFTYEDTVVAYYLTALLREEHAAGLNGIVKTVAVQQEGHGHPMDDIIVEFDDDGSTRRLGLQAKRNITISAAETNGDFRDIISQAVATRATEDFNADLDAYGFVVEHVAVERFRTLKRLIDWAKGSPTADYFARRFAPGGAAAEAERSLRSELAQLIDAQSPDDERRFYAQFRALKLDGLTEGGVLRTEVVNRLQELVAASENGHDLLLFDRLCRVARESAGNARKWTRQALLAELRGVVRLKVAPNYRHDIGIFQSFSRAGLADVSEEIDGIHVERLKLESDIRDRLAEHKLVNLSGLPGCGKSAMLKRIANSDADSGPILFLKSDRLEGSSWLTFATALGLRHRVVADLLAEIGSTGAPILFIDGIDRIRPDHKGIITDILKTIEENEHLANWVVLASSRDQGLEPYRAWFPASFYHGSGIGDVTVAAFSNEEAEVLAKERPSLRRLLFGQKSVSEIGRRPFFAAVLARSFPDDSATPQTEVDLISAWWSRAGHDAAEEAVPQRQRALLDLAEKGIRNLGKNIPARLLKDSTFEQVAGLMADHVIRANDDGASYSFSHDIFFEWVFFRQLIEVGDEWPRSLTKAGEPPLLGRVVGLLAQNAFASPGKWSAGYRDLEGQPLRPQWRREWLTAPAFTPTFEQGHQEFEALVSENDYALLEKLLVWFQAQHTIPNPVFLTNATDAVEGLDLVEAADLLGWPSDVIGWGRLLDWLLPLAPSLPVRLLPHILEVFNVWQNVFAELKNRRSEAIINVCAGWLSEARSRLATNLRTTILRSAKSYPSPAVELFERAVENKPMRRAAYSELIGFTFNMADVAPEAVVAVAKAELMEELPLERIEREEREEREHAECLKRLRAIPEEDRTEEQKRALQPVGLLVGGGRIDLHDIGIDQYHNYYFPPSPIHEPFASLFAKKPKIALGLVADLANHATKGWRQVQLLDRDSRGTPIPVVLEFPWGKQEFWGDWHVYNWFMGQLAPNPLDCAFLALSYWAFKQIEGGRPASEVIRSVVEGSECYAVLGLALVLALETSEVSETTLPIVTCQRLWHHDIARVVQEPTRDIDLFGLEHLSRLTGGKAKAKEFLDSRQSHKREVRELVMHFVLKADDSLRKRFKEVLARFSDHLPFEIEEHRSSPSVTASLKETAVIWAGLGDSQNYRKHQTEHDEVLISYESPNKPTPPQEKRLERGSTALQEYSVVGWATKSLEADEPAEGLSLTDAVAFAQARDTDTIFAERKDAGEHSAQTAISAVAAVVIFFGPTSGEDYDWAWDVMGRIAVMREPKDTFHASKIPWHPANYQVLALAHDRRSSSPRQDSLQRLFELTTHPLDGVVQFAFKGLLGNPDEHVRWVAAQLAMDLSLYYRFTIDDNGKRDNTANLEAQKKSLARALDHLDQTTDEPLTSIPPAWVETTESQHSGWHENEPRWIDPDPSFNAFFAVRIFPLFPIETWCQSSLYKPMVEVLLKELVAWTAERLVPSWSNDSHRRLSGSGRSELIEWNDVLGVLLARAAPSFEAEFVHKEFLAPFLADNEEGLAVIAEFAGSTVARHVFDAPMVPENTFDLLNKCVDRILRDRCFDPNSYRAGEVHGVDLPKLIKELLFVFIVEDAPGATRFANGDWTQIGIIMPIVTRLVTAIGWSPFVMDTFLTLCEWASAAYPLDAFATQVNAVLDSLPNAKGSWAGTRLPARIAATVQRLVDANFPIRADQAQELLRVLDALIDLGDRRSAALEQTEAFREVQMQ